MNSRMLYTSLLGMPEDVEEPTAYQLLGITPEEATPERVAEALEERRQYARKNVPNPRLIPAVMLLETELQQAADILSDPKKRAAYDAKHKIGRPTPETTDREARKNELRRFIRRQVKELSEPDRTMTAANKEELARRLAAEGIAQKTIDRVLEQIPDAAESKGPATGAVTDFFEEAVDMALQKGILSPEDRQRFVEMGKSFGVDVETANRIIESKMAGGQAAKAPAEAPAREPVAEKPPEQAVEPAEPSHEENLKTFEARLREICPSARPDNAQKQTLAEAMRELRISRDDAMSIIKKVRKEYDAAKAERERPPEAAPEPRAEEPAPEPRAEPAPAQTPEKVKAAPAEPSAAEAKKEAPTRRKRRKRPLRILGMKLKLEMIIPVVVVILFVLFIWFFNKYLVGE